MLTLDLESYRWKHRVLVHFGDRAAFRPAKDDLKERDLILIQPEPNQDAELRKRFRLQGGFALILIGKDGGEKGRWLKPVAPEEIYKRIDAMPMRQSEMKSPPR